MIISSINFLQLQDRLDAEYYKPEYISLAKPLRGANILGEYIQNLTTGQWVEKWCFNKGIIPYIKVEQIKEFFLEKADDKINKECLLLNKNPMLEERDILLGRVGTVGISSIFIDRTKVTFSDNVIRIRLKDINPYYVVTLLNSKLGRFQIDRLTKEAVQGVINYQSIKSIKIPTPSVAFQNKIEQMVKEAHKKRQQADEKYQEAEKILEDVLGLKDLGLSTETAYETKFSDTQDRLDPEYYQPKYQRIRKSFISSRKYQVVHLGNLTKSVKYGTSDKVIYVDKGIPFLRVTDINKFYTIEPEEGKFISSYEATRLKDYKVAKGDLLVSRTGTLGSVVYIDERLTNSIYGSYFIKVTLKNRDTIDPFFASIFLNSKFGKWQAESLGSGGVQTNLTIDMIKSLIIPVLPKPVQQKITRLVQESFRLRRESKTLLTQAKNKVEDLIEKGK